MQVSPSKDDPLGSSLWCEAWRIMNVKELPGVSKLQLSLQISQGFRAGFFSFKSVPQFTDGWR